jgi:hypothetical protein
MVEQMFERFPGNRNPHLPHMRVIRLRQYARMVLLREVDLPGGAFYRSPVFYPPLQCPELAVTKRARLPSL